MYHLMQTSFPPLGAQQGGGDGVPLGLPGPGHLGVQLPPQDPQARGGLGPAQGELLSKLQLSSEHSCLAPSRPMGARHEPNLCAESRRMRTQYIVFSAVQDAALRLMTQVPAWSREQLPPTAAVLCRGLQNKPQSTASQPNIRHPATTPGQVLPGVSGRRTRRGP